MDGHEQGGCAGASYGIRVVRQRLGRDDAFFLTGGEAHIGAAATAFLDKTGEAVVVLATVPGHREDELCRRWAKQATERLRRTVLVAAGIHFAGIGKTEIERIVREADEAMERAVAEAE